MPNYGPISSTLPSGQRPSLRKGAGCLNYSHNLNGTVTEVKVSFVLRIPHDGEITSSRTYNGIKFYLYKKNSPTVASLPGDWARHSGFYYGSTSLSKSYIPEENILAQNLNFSLGPTDKISNNCSATFELTDFGKNLSNWSGEVILACVDHGTEKNGKTEILQWSTGSTCSYTLTYLEQSVIPASSLTPITLGTTSTIYFTSYSSSYTHEITWVLGSKSYTVNIAAGKTSASCPIPTDWRDQFSTTKTTQGGNILIKTKNANEEQIGTINSYGVTYNIDNYDLSSSIKLTCSKVTPSSSDRFSNNIFSGFLVKNYHKVRLAVTASADYNNTIKKYTLTYGSNSTVTGTGVGTLAKNYIYSGTSGSYSITDSRNKTKTINFNTLTGISQTLTTYTPCSYSSIDYYRATSSGVKNEIGGSYLKIKINNFKKSSTNPSISGLTTSIRATVNGVTKTIDANNPEILISANLTSDREYQLQIIFSDNSGYSVTFTGKILSSNYLLHFRKDQASVGIGQAARDLSSGSYSNYSSTGLLSINYQIELARGLNSQRCFTSPIRTIDGGTGCSDLNDFVDQIASSILAKAYPIGSLYFTTNATNPKNILGFGTWEAWGAGRVPIGVGTYSDGVTSKTFSSAEQSGGEYNHTLLVDEMPSHAHKPGTNCDKATAEYPTNFSTNVSLSSSETERVKLSAGSKGYAITGTAIEYLGNSPTTDNAGGGLSHNNIQPYITCYIWKRIS